MADTRRITASEFRTHCLRLMREVAVTGEEIIITKRGKPTARILPPNPMPIEPVPVRDDSWKSLIGSVTYPGDILSPVGEE